MPISSLLNSAFSCFLTEPTIYHQKFSTTTHDRKIQSGAPRIGGANRPGLVDAATDQPIVPSVLLLLPLFSLILQELPGCEGREPESSAGNHTMVNVASSATKIPTRQHAPREVGAAENKGSKNKLEMCMKRTPRKSLQNSTTERNQDKTRQTTRHTGT